MNCIKHPKVEAYQPFLILKDGEPLPLCKQDIIDLKSLINFKVIDPIGEKRIPDNIKNLDNVEQQKTIGMRIDIISKSDDGNKLESFLKSQ